MKLKLILKRLSPILLLAVFILLLTSCKDTIKAEIAVKNDTLKVLNINQKEDLEKNGFYAAENYVIANKALLRNIPNTDNSKVIDTLNFGAKFYIKSVYSEEETDGESANNELLNDENKNGFVAIYLKKPTSLKDKPVGFLTAKVMVDEYAFKDYKKYFSLPEFKKLDSNIKRALLENTYFDGNSYYLTQNSQKAAQVMATGDFDGDGAKDYAFILDNIEKEYSTVVIFLINKATKEPYIAYHKAYTDFLKLKPVAKGSTIEVSENNNSGNKGKTLPFDAISTFYDGKHFFTLLYNATSNKFEEIPYE